MVEGFRAASATVSVLTPTKAVARLHDVCFKCQTMLRRVQTNNNLKGTSLYVGCSSMELTHTHASATVDVHFTLQSFLLYIISYKV